MGETAAPMPQIPMGKAQFSQYVQSWCGAGRAEARAPGEQNGSSSTQCFGWHHRSCSSAPGKQVKARRSQCLFLEVFHGFHPLWCLAGGGWDRAALSQGWGLQPGFCPAG